MNEYAMAKTPATCRSILSALFIGLCFLVGSAGVQAPADAASGDEIVAVDIPYRLFLSLARYEELTAAEHQGKNMTADLIPVLEAIVDALKSEKEKFAPLVSGAGANIELRRRLNQLDDLIADYVNELRYRRKAMALERLLEHQNTLIKGE